MLTLRHIFFNPYGQCYDLLRFRSDFGKVLVPVPDPDNI